LTDIFEEYFMRIFQARLSVSFVAAVAILIVAGTAKAVTIPGSFTFNIAPDGAGNVVVNGSGDVNLGSAFSTLFSTSAQMSSFSDLIVNGPATTTNVTEYTFSTALTGPASFGTVFGATPASSGSGNMFMFDNTGFGSFILAVPVGYTTDSPISNFSTYNNRTLSQLGLTPGTFTWTMGTGNTENTVIINVSATPVPEPSTLALLTLGSVIAFATRRR
jgi:PEP-CTERM motif-containing protein